MKQKKLDISKSEEGEEPQLIVTEENKKKVDISSLKTSLWDAACVIRGPKDASKFKDYILPLVFLKRISDVYEDEIEESAKELGSKEVAEEINRFNKKSYSKLFSNSTFHRF